MGLFSRNKPKAAASPTQASVSPVTAFWMWWRDAGHRLDPSTASAGTEQLTSLLHNIHPELTWHFGKGNTSQHRLTVSAGGNPEARPHAARWHRAAPPADETWEFAPAVQPDPDALKYTLELGGARLDLSLLTFGVEISVEERRVHVEVYHPDFANVPENVRTQITYLATDWALGEDCLERWIGQLSPTVDAPEAPTDAAGLGAAVAQLVDAREADGWMVLGGEDEQGRPVLVMARSGYRWIDRPTLDRHHMIAAAFRADENGMPIPEAAEKLDAFEDELISLVEPGGLFVARQTGDGVRLFHLYTDSEDHNAADRIAQFTARYEVHHEAAPDPGWSQVRPFTG